MIRLRRRILRSGLIIAIVCCAAGCDPSPKNGAALPPCGAEGLARIELGRPLGREVTFVTSGGTLYATAYGFTHGGFGNAEVGVTRLFIGRGTPERVDAGQRPEGTLVSLRVVEDDYSELDLPAGEYWLVSSNDADVALLSCSANGVKPVP